MFKENARITIIVTIRSGLQCLKGKGPNHNIYKDKVRFTMFVMIRSALQCL